MVSLSFQMLTTWLIKLENDICTFTCTFSNARGELHSTTMKVFDGWLVHVVIALCLLSATHSQSVCDSGNDLVSILEIYVSMWNVHILDRNFLWVLWKQFLLYNIC